MIVAYPLEVCNDKRDCARRLRVGRAGVDPERAVRGLARTGEGLAELCQVRVWLCLPPTRQRGTGPSSLARRLFLARGPHPLQESPGVGMAVPVNGRVGLLLQIRPGEPCPLLGTGIHR